MKLDRKEYQALCARYTPPSPSRRTLPAAFAVGGAVCLLGQVLRTLYENAGLEEKAAGTAQKNRITAKHKARMRCFMETPFG